MPNEAKEYLFNASREAVKLSKYTCTVSLSLNELAQTRADAVLQT